MWLSDALSSKRITKPYSEPIQTVLTTSRNRTWKQPKPYSICTRTKACFFSFSVGLTREILWELAHFRIQTVRETVLGQRLNKGTLSQGLCLYAMFESMARHGRGACRCRVSLGLPCPSVLHEPPQLVALVRSLRNDNHFSDNEIRNFENFPNTYYPKNLLRLFLEITS